MAKEDEIKNSACGLIEELNNAGKAIAVAESCTGGWITKALTDVSGSSQCFSFGIVSYSDEAKISMLSVSAVTLEEYGAVSSEAVAEMATGALGLSGADFAVAVSGIAGPDGGTTDKPVGTVWVAWAVSTAGGPVIDTAKRVFLGNREAIREQTVLWALKGVGDRLKAQVRK